MIDFDPPFFETSPALHGVHLMKSDLAEIGKPIVFTDVETGFAQTIFAHPIDLIWFQYSGDVNTAHELATEWIHARIDRMVAQANDRLDRMVEAGANRQRNRQLRFEIFGTGDRRKVFKHLYGGATDIPYRTYDEQRRLYERWRAHTNPDGLLYPGHQSHHVGGLAIDVFDNAGRRISDFNEPWHIEHWGGPMKRKPWWKRALYRMGLLR